MMENPSSVDYKEVTQRQQKTWATGDFHEVARQNVCMAEAVCEAADLHATNRVLDVACGSGTAALVAARRYCEVTGIDYVPALIDRAKKIAAASGLDARFQVADAQDLPFNDNSFDHILSVYGVQFAPKQEKAAEEMLRVCRSGGSISLASPIGRGWSGDFFALNARYLPPPAGVKSPLRWGSEQGLTDLFGDGARSIWSEERKALQYYRSVDHAVSDFLRYFGPTIRASETLEGAGRSQLISDLKDIFHQYNRAKDGSAVIENRYLLTVIHCT